jgi:2'-5' RNA ligase
MRTIGESLRALSPHRRCAIFVGMPHLAAQPGMRAFIAVDLGAAIRDGVDEIVANLKRTPGARNVRWVAAQNIHLTLKFLGNLPPGSHEQVKQVLSTVAAATRPMEVEIGELGYFPSARTPRVLWIGVQGAPELAGLQRMLEAATVKLGFPREDRAYSPHLTIGRVRNGTRATDMPDLLDHMNRLNPAPVGRMRITAIHLFSSTLTPSGPEYRKISSASLVSHGDP